MIDLFLSMYAWAKFRHTKGAVKIHLQLDHQDYLPRWALITDGKTHDVTVVKKAHFEPETVMVLDKVYNDYGMFGAWTDNRVSFVTRMKENALYRAVERRSPPRRSNGRKDQAIHLTGVKAEEKYPPSAAPDCGVERRAKTDYCSLDQSVGLVGGYAWTHLQRTLTNRDLLQSIQYNLCIRTFVGASENAVKTQIWISLIAILLLKYLQLRSTYAGSLSN